MCTIKHSFRWNPLLLVRTFVLAVTVLGFQSPETPGSYLKLRTPRLELRPSGDVGAVLHFYNTDTLNIGASKEDAVKCTVEGGHLEYTPDGWKPLISVSLNSWSTIETWRAPEGLSAYDSDVLQTRITYNVSGEVEGYLKCRDNLGLGLASNEILLRSKYESVIVRLVSPSVEELRNITEGYQKHSYSKQIGRLFSYTKHSRPEAMLRVSYIREGGDQGKMVNDVRELTDYISLTHNVTVKYIRSARYCPLVEEGNFTWPMTLAGISVTPDNPCVDANGDPGPSRRCLGDFFEGVYWDVSPHRPELCLVPSKRAMLFLNANKMLGKRDIIEELWKEIAHFPPLSPTEVYFLSEALRKAANELSKPSTQFLIPNVFSIVGVVSAILQSKDEVIKMAEDTYGSSTTILESIDKLMMAVASPMPKPVSMPHFSAYASIAGTGNQGFTYVPSSSPNEAGEMMTIDRINKLNDVLYHDPNVVAYLHNQTEDFGIVSTLYRDGTFFSDAATSDLKLEGPVIGIKLFQNGHEDLREQTPTLLTIKYIKGLADHRGLRCVSWDHSRAREWAFDGCTVLSTTIKTFTLCTCKAVTMMNMYYSVVNDTNNKGFDMKRPSLELTPLKDNDGALVTMYNLQVINKTDSTEKLLHCYAKSERRGDDQPVVSEPMDSIKLKEIGLYSYGLRLEMAVFHLNYEGEGDVQCEDTLGYGLLSNIILILKQNTAVVRFSFRSSDNVNLMIDEYTRKRDSKYKFKKLPSGNANQNSVVFDNTFHVYGSPEEDHADFIQNVTSFAREFAASRIGSVVYVRSNRLCLSQEEGGFTWPNTRQGHMATPINPCLDAEGAPIPRRGCLGDRIVGFYWDSLPLRPIPCHEPSKLKGRFLGPNVEEVQNEVLSEVMDETEDSGNLSAAEVQYLSLSLKLAAESKNVALNLSLTGKVVNAILGAEKNWTNDKNDRLLKLELLESIDKLIEKSSTIIPSAVDTESFSVIAAAPGSRFRGYVILENSTKYLNLIPIYWNQSVEYASDQSLKMAALLLEGPEYAGMSFTRINGDKLFGGSEEYKAKSVDSHVFGARTFGGGDHFSNSNLLLLLLFPRDMKVNKKYRQCNFWNGVEWSTEGCFRVAPCDIPIIFSGDMDACLCTHLTHFAMLVSNVDSIMTEDEVLNIITIVACSISNACLLGIFLVAIISTEWRSDANKKIQLSLSASLVMLLTSYLFVASLGECPQSMTSCITLGGVIHYSILASFSWMLVIAALQTLRLSPSKAIDARRRAGTHLVLKASAIGWGFPLVPVVATLIWDPHLYGRRPNSALCYPDNSAFYFAVLFPISAIVVINTVIFAWIMRMLYCTKTEGLTVHQGGQRRRSVRRFLQALFLFFLLGVSWLCGLAIEASRFSEAIVRFLAYLFCVTATLQGASLFVFFVVLDRRLKIEGLAKIRNYFSHFRNRLGTDIPVEYNMDDPTELETLNTCTYSK